MDSQTVFAALRDVLAELYPEEQDARLVVTDAGLDTKRISFSARAQTNWYNILTEAAKAQRVDALVEVARLAYGENATLQIAYTHYHHLTAQGKRLGPPEQATAGDDAPAAGESPYKGLQYFTDSDADLFYGREELTARLVGYLHEQRFLAVVGASGSGKSSVMRAGVVPGLKRGAVLADGTLPPAGSTGWPIHVITPTAHPLEELATSLTRDASLGATLELAHYLAQNPRTLHLAVRRVLSGGTASRLLLIVDQFEELFTLCRSKSEQQAFVDNLLAATDPAEDTSTTVILTLRADFYAHCAQFDNLRTALAKQQEYIGPMTPAELRRAIELPAQCNGWILEPGLVDLLLQDSGQEPGTLPLLSHALLETWQRRQGHTLTLAGYTATGRVQGAIAKTAETVYRQHLDDKQQVIARNIFLRLTELGEGAQDTRRRVARAELTQLGHEASTVEEVLHILAAARLITTAQTVTSQADAPPTAADVPVTYVDVAHEALIRAWPRLREWLADDREGLRLHRRLTEAAHEWQANGSHDPNDLYRGNRLSQVQEWAATHAADLNQVEQAFLHASQAETDAQAQREAALVAEREANRQHELENQRQRAQLFRNWSIVAGVFLLLAIIAAGASFYLNGQLNDKNTKLSNTNNQLHTSLIETKRLANVSFSRQLAAQSTSELNKNNYEVAVLLAIESGQVTETIESYVAIRDSLAHPWHTSAVLYGHTGGVEQATWSKDESKILTRSYDHTARIWDAATGKALVTLTGHTEPVNQAMWSKDESKILTASYDSAARIWDAATGQALITLTGHTEGVEQATWSQDESKILTASWDHTARIWDAATGKALVTLTGHTGIVNQATWSKDESKILTHSDDSTARIWDAATGKVLVTLTGHTESVNQATWSKDESKILTVSWDHTARIWDAATGQALITLTGHTGIVKQATWSKDESKILTRSADHTARIWDAATGKALVTLTGHTGGVNQATWSKDESKILTRSDDSTARIWDAATGKALVTLAGHTELVNQATWSKDESKILTVSWDQTVRIWDAATGKELATLAGHTGDVNQAMWNQDESKILTASDDSTARIWDAATGKELVTLTEHTGIVDQAMWNQDESKILTASWDHTARIWDAATGKELVTLAGHTGIVYQATWSKDESKILTRSDDDTARIWDAATGKVLVTLAGHTGGVNQATWNQDESKILTRSDDSMARIWDAATGQALITLTGHTGGVEQATWNQNESKILTRSWDRTARIWDAATGKALVTLIGHANYIYQATWSQDESKILTASWDQTARIWDAATGKELVTLTGHTGGVYRATWNQDESKILTRSADHTARIWDAATGQALAALTGHTGGVNQATWSQDESKILTRSDDNTARIWDAATGKALITLTGHTNHVYQATWSQDESKILTASWDHTARIWDAATGQALVTLTGHTGGVYRAMWNQDESKILTRSADHTARISYTHMVDLVTAACKWTPRSLNWNEWRAYLRGEDRKGEYTPTCPNAPIPPDAIAGIQEEARAQIQAGYVLSGTQRLDQLNGWLQENGQAASFGVDTPAFVAQVVATATAEAAKP